MIPVVAQAQPAPDVARQANALLRDGDAQSALALYGETKTPLPPRVAYDKALAHLALGQVDEARPLLVAASHASEDVAVAARARFNLGYLAFQEGSSVAESDPAAAIDAFTRSAKAFQASYDLDPSDQQASRNIELARLAIRKLEERIEEQKKQQQQQQQQQNDLAEQLKDLAQEQEQLAEESKQAQSADQTEQERAEQTERIDQKQDDLNKRTQEAKDKLEQMQEQQESEASQNASQQLEQAQEKQQNAGESLKEQELQDAASEQAQAAELLRRAAETLQSENKQEQPQEDGSEGDPQQDEASDQSPDQGEQQQPSRLEQMLQQLLDKERQEREDRKRGAVAKPGTVRPVEKDW